MRGLSCASLVLVAAIAQASEPITGYEFLADWADLPRARTGLTPGLASSYDRLGGNKDYNHYESPTGLLEGNYDTTVVTLDGPGVLTRFWMPHATADAAFPLTVTVDGQVVIETDTDAFLGGGSGHTSAPITSTLIGGQVSYEPIAFQESLKIESANFGSGGYPDEYHYYQHNYYRLPAGTEVTPYTGTPSPAQQAGSDAVAAMLNAAGSNPAGPRGDAETTATGPMTLQPGETASLVSIHDSGHIRALHLDPGTTDDAELDGLRLRIRYEGRSQPAVDMPLSEFFGAGHGRADFASLPIGAGAEGLYSYWPMPFRKQVEVELHNAGAAAASVDGASVELVRETVGPEEGYFHAVSRHEVTTTEQPTFELLSVEGEGLYVGNRLSVLEPTGYRMVLEGDDIVVADGQGLYGTGLEDAYNGGYYYNHVLEQDDDGDIPDPESGTGPLHGLLRMRFDDLGDEDVLADQYRWLIADAVPFSDSLTVLNENYGTHGGVTYDSVACFYLLPLGGDADLDGRVDVEDLGILAGNWRTQDGSADWTTGDFDGNGNVDVTDLGILAGNWKQAQAAPSSVPGPLPAALLAAGAAVLVRRR